MTNEKTDVVEKLSSDVEKERYGLLLADGNWYNKFGSNPPEWLGRKVNPKDESKEAFYVLKEENPLVKVTYTTTEKDGKKYRNIQEVEPAESFSEEQKNTKEYTKGKTRQESIREMHEEKTENIRRQVALKCAVQVSENMTLNEVSTAFYRFDQLLKEGELKED